MRKVLFLVGLFAFMMLRAQPLLVNTTPYAAVTSIAYDSVGGKIFYNYLYGCPTWNTPCAYSYSMSSQNNLINKHYFTDNNVDQVLGSKYQVACPSYPVNNYNSAFSRQTKYVQNSIYTNFGFHFNRVDSNFLNPVPIWTYSPASNPSFKEISVFEMKGDSIFLFEKDSTSGKNYYSVLVKNRVNGSPMAYNSLLQSNPSNSLGAIEGHVHASVLVGNKIILAGVFTASISGVFVGRNLATLNLSSGQLSVSSSTFAAGSAIYDLKKEDGKIFLCGKFTQIGGSLRNNFAALDEDLTLLPETIQFGYTGIDGPSNTWVDKLIFYDKYLIAKGNYGSIDGQVLNAGNSYWIKVIDVSNNNLVMPWSINLPGVPLIADYTFQMFKHKLYVKNRNSLGSPFYIYCFAPIKYSNNILFPGSTLAAPSPSISLCAPDNGNQHIFVAPIRFAGFYNWTYSGSNATLVPLGNGSTAKLIVSNASTNGLLSVTGSNDCGQTTASSTLAVSIFQKPVFVLPNSPQTIICNPDSNLLQGTSTGSNVLIWWRKDGNPTEHVQPYYTKSNGNYYMVVRDNDNNCRDSGMIVVQSNQVKPNSKIQSHVYPGVAVPIDTVTCYKPTVIINAASDTSGVVINWKSIADNSLFVNPLSMSTMGNLKVIVTRTVNNCVDSSLIVLVGQDNQKPVISIASASQNINCSQYTTSLNALFTPSNCTAQWTGPISFTATNPAEASMAGVYHLNVNNPENGCSRKDSVTVIADKQLLLKCSNDTTVCKFSNINLSAVRIGTLSDVTYSWNTGQSGKILSASPGGSTTYIVYANGPGDCYGSDTIYVSVPSDIKDSIVAYRNCDNQQNGSLIMFASGGIPPYKYSIDNGLNFYNNNSFSNIPFDNYQVLIKDAIGCVRSSSISLSDDSNLPLPKFLASTRNFIKDTIVLVDISIPQADSVKWILPPHVLLIGGSMFSPVITTSDTGQFVITMQAFYGNCIIRSHKLIRMSDSDSLMASTYNANGIKTFSIYPNPNSGRFNVKVEFFRKQNASLQVWNSNSQKFWQENVYQSDQLFYSLDLSSLENGTYLLRLIGEYDARTKPFIIEK